MADNYFDKFDPSTAKPDGGGGNYFDRFDPATAKPEPKRTWGEAIKDTGAQLAEGVNTTLGAIPSVVAPQSKAAGFFRDNAEHWRDKQSDVLKGRIAETDKRIQEAGKDGVMSQIGTAASEYWNDPAQAARLVATNLPSMAATLGAGATAGFAAKGVAAARGMDAAGKAALAAKYGTTTAAATNAALNAGGARGEAFEDLQKTALAQGMSPEQAEQAGVSGSILPGVVGGVAGAISGKMGLEKALLGQATAGAATRKAAGAFGAELTGEQIEELAPKVATNYQVGQLDAARGLTDDLGRTMVETAIGAGPGAVVAGGAAGMRAGEDATAPSADESTTEPGAPATPQPQAGPTLALPAPDQGVIAVGGDGTARTPAYQKPSFAGEYADVTDVVPRELAHQPADPMRSAVESAANSGGALSNAALVAIDSGVTPRQESAFEDVPDLGAQPQQVNLDEIADPYDRAYYESLFDDEPAPLGAPPVLSAFLQDDDNIPDFDAANNVSEEDFLRALGADELEIQDAIATTPDRAESAPEGAAFPAGPQADVTAGAPEGAGAGAAQPAGPVADAPTNLRDALARVRAQKQEAANAQAATPPAAPAAAAVPAAGPGAVEAAGSATTSTTTGVASEPQTDQTQQASTQPAQAGPAQPAQGLTNAAPAENHGAQGTPAPGAQAQTSDAAPAENSEQRAQRVAAAGESWTRMPAAERQALAQRTDLRPVVQKNVHRAQWADLNGGVQRKIADAMASAAGLVPQVGAGPQEAIAEQGVNLTGTSPEQASVATKMEAPPAAVQGSVAAVPTAKKVRGVLAKKVKADEKARTDYFAPGNIVRSYGGHDRVISYTPPGDNGQWSVTVQAVRKEGDSWVDAPDERSRMHATPPDAKALKDGPVMRATPTRQAESVEGEVSAVVRNEQDASRSPEDFVPTPDGGLDYGEITPEMGKAMRRQAGKIRLRRGDETQGLLHIEARHLDQFKKRGFESVPDFVASVAKAFTAIYKRDGAALDVVLEDGDRGRLVVQLELAADGDFYDVKTASPIREDQFKNREPLWERAGTSAPTAGESSSPSPWGQNGVDSVPPTNPAAQPITRAEVDAAQQQAPGKPIEDFGEKIGGARKDVWAGFKDDLNKVDDGDIAAQPLSKVWPAPDYQKLIDAGMDAKAVAMVRALRDEVPAKPRSPWKVKRWAEQVKTLRGLANDVMDGKVTVQDMERMGASKGTNLRGMLGRIELYELVGHGKSLEGMRFSHHHYSLYKGRENVSLWVVEKESSASAFSNWPTEIATGDTKEQALAAFKEKYDSLDVQSAARKAAFDIFSERGGDGFYVGKKIGRNYAKLEGPFKTVKEAREYRQNNMAALEAKLEKYKEIPRERADVNQPRVGVDMRNGQDVTPQMFGEVFGFRGVEFGNYVEQKRRQRDLNDAFDALMDMAAVLDIPAKAISLNGKLGLAFGARGSGGVNPAAAHYEPGSVVINLTKKAGAGSLGHEWWHALDNYFAKQRATHRGTYMTTGTDVSLAARGKAYFYEGGVRQEMVDAFGAVVSAINRTAMRERSSRMDAKRTKEYWTTGEEMAARAFESYLIAKLQDQSASNDYLANVVSQKTWDAMASLGMANENSYPYPTAAEVPAIRAGFDHFFQTVETKETEGGNVAMFSRTPATKAAYEARIDALYAGGKPLPHGVRVLDRSDMLGLLGMGSGPVHLVESKVEQGRFNHGLSAADWKKVPGWLDDPAMVFDSETQPGRLVFIAPEMVNGSPVRMIVDPRPDGQGVNLLVNAYDADRNPFQRWERDGLMRYFDQQKAPSVTGSFQPRLTGLPGDRGRNKILTEKHLGGYRRANTPAAFMGQPTPPADSNARNAATQLLVDGLKAKWTRAPEIIVARNMQDTQIPQAVRDYDATLKSQGSDGEARGFIYKGKVYLLSDQLDGPGQIAEVLFHEVLGHYGLRGVFGDSLKPILQQMGTMRRADVLAKAREYGMVKKGLSDAATWAAMSEQDRLSAAEEVLAEMAQTQPNIGFVQRAIAAIRNWLRAHVPGFERMRLTDADIVQAYILPARGYVTRSNETAQQAIDRAMMAFSRSPGSPGSSGSSVTFDPTNPDIRFSRASNAAAAAAGAAIKSVTATHIKQRAGFKLTDYLGLGLQALGRRQIVDVYGDMLPLAEYNTLVTQMEADKNEGGAEADKLVKRWAELPDEGKLADLMNEATLAQIDPAKPYVGGDDKAKYAMLAGRFKALSQEAKQVYTDTRDAYQGHHAKVRSAIKERIERSELKGPRKAELLKQMDDEFFAAVKGVYFPLARFGQYAVTVKGADGKVESVSRAETKAEAEALRNSLLSAFPRDKGFTVGRVMLSKDFIADRDAVGRGFMTELYQVLDKQDMDAAQRAELEDTLGQLYLSSLPDLSWAKHGIHRKGTPGFSQDARRAYAQNMFHGSRYLAKLRYSDLMQDELTAMQKHVDDWREVEDFDQNSAQRVVDEMNKRHESLMNPKSNPLSTALTSFGFIFHLGLSPASAMVNLSQTALVAYPIMGAKWGFGKASAALLKASAEATKGKNDITGSLNADERAAYDEAVRAGTIDVTMAHDLAGIAQGEDAGVMWKIRPVMRWASFLFHHAERFNRQVTFVASYRLAREAGADQKAAFEQATKATYDGHFDYGAANRPRVMQGNVAKVLLLFKQYGQNMVYTLSRSAYQSIKGTDAEKAEARKVLAGLLTSHAMAAGVLGLPMVTTLLAAASMIGGDDDEPWDAQTALQNILADAFGQKPAEVLARGLSRLTPWDISGRVGLDRLIFPDVQEGLEGQRLAESAMAAALGPVAGIGVNVLKGAQHMSEGRYALGLEAMLPSALRGPVKAIRYANEGVQDKSGISILDEVSPAAVAGQALGFSPSQARNAQEGKSAVMAHDRALGERRQELLTRAARASMTKDSEALDDARKEIARFNEKNPGRRINPNHIMQSVRNRNKRIDQAQDGVYLPKSRRDAMEAGRFALGD